MNTKSDDLHTTHDPAQPSDSSLAVAPPSPTRKIFFGDSGLRAGWCLLIFIAQLAALIVIANVIGHNFFPSNKNAPANADISLRFGFLAEGLPLLAVLLVTWIMSKIERRPISVYGLGDSRKFPHFFAGLAWGLACLSLLVFTLWKTGFLVFDGRLLFGAGVFGYGALWLIGFLLVGVFEEYLTRGYLQYTLTRAVTGLYQWAFKTRHSGALGFWTSAIVISIFFGLGHSSNAGESPLGLLSAGLGGMVFCFSLWRTGSLWWAIGFHTSWDWSQSFLYGVADSGLMIQHRLLAAHALGKPILSGGTTGPEGSIFIVAILPLIALIIFLSLPPAREGYTASLSKS